MDDYLFAGKELIQQWENDLDRKIYKKVNTPFGYFGSKNKIAKQLCNTLPIHSCWVEAFCGSAALTLSKKKSPIEVINDIDDEIVNVFQQLRDNEQELCRLVSLTPYSKSEFEQSRTRANSDNKLERARKFLVQAMMAVNGSFGKDRGGFSYSQSYSRNGRDARVNRWYNLPERLTNVVERLRDVRIDNRDGIEILKMFLNRPATLVYLDPPYLTKRSSGYTNDVHDEDYHHELIRVSLKAKCMMFLSGYENDLYNDLLTKENGWDKRNIPTTTKDTTGSRIIRNEVIWTNQYFRTAIEQNKLPIELTEKELKLGKVNPER